jgi:cell division protease FtsH
MERSAKDRRTGGQEHPVAVPRSASAVLGGASVLRAADVDVGQARERRRQRRLARLAVVLWVATLAAWWRVLSGGSLNPLGGLSLGPDAMLWLPAVLLVVLIAVLMLVPMAGQGRSPHLLYRPEQIDVGLDDVKGLGPLRDEVVKTLNLFLGYATFKDRLGGNPRRGILFEGKPGTGKTHMAKAMARHAGVPFLFVSATSFQSMWYGMTARKIRAYFKALRKVARQEGGAIGFIEEIDAIGGRRGGVEGGGEGPVSSGTGGVVNELLVQLQSFDAPPFSERLAGRLIDWVNGWMPSHAQLAKRPPRYNNILVIAATNRAESLDPALLRPGRFDRRLYFDLPNAVGRRELIDYFLARKAHHPELDDDARRAELAHITFGYTPVMIEHLLDESLVWALRAGRDGMRWVDVNQAKLSEEIGLKQPVAYTPVMIEHLLDESLVWALRAGRDAMRWADVNQAKLSEEIGLKQPVAYTPLEKEMVATHEAGHAVAAYLSGVGRRLEVLSIVKRKDALGLLAHNDTEERWTRTRTELLAFLRIACAGMAAEELWFGESTTGPGGDLVGATGIAAQMVGALGMTDSLVSFVAMEEGLNERNVVAKVLSDPEGRERTDRLLKEAKTAVKEQLDRHRFLVEALRDALLEREELIGDEILEVLRQAEAALAVPVAIRSAPSLLANRPEPPRLADPGRAG